MDPDRDCPVKAVTLASPSPLSCEGHAPVLSQGGWQEFMNEAAIYTALCVCRAFPTHYPFWSSRLTTR